MNFEITKNIKNVFEFLPLINNFDKIPLCKIDQLDNNDDY